MIKPKYNTEGKNLIVSDEFLHNPLDVDKIVNKICDTFKPHVLIPEGISGEKNYNSTYQKESAKHDENLNLLNIKRDREKYINKNSLNCSFIIHRNANMINNNMNNYETHLNESNGKLKKSNFSFKRDSLDDIDYFDSINHKFIVQKIPFTEENDLEINNGNIPSDNSLNNLKSGNNKNNGELRKYKTDSIHKKIKVNIIKLLRDFIIDNLSNLKIPNLSQEIVTNVNISYNKDLLEKKIYDIFYEDWRENYCEVIQEMRYKIREKKEFGEIMNMKLREFVEEKYWKSDFHRIKLKAIYDTETPEYFLQYAYVDREFINYFMNNRANRKKKGEAK